MFELMPYATRRNIMNPFTFFDNDFWGTAGEIKTDITDTGDAFKLEADLPGFKKDDIKIDLENDRLTISKDGYDTETIYLDDYYGHYRYSRYSRRGGFNYWRA